VPGVLPSEVLDVAESGMKAFQSAMPPGYKMEIGCEQEEQSKGFTSLAIAMAISVTSLFLALVFQFKNVVKPLIVFAVTPSGMVRSLIALWIMGTAFDFMAFLGIASLIGVIVSHIT
jgi:multidrug efflux pump subunit AcrB